MDFSDFLSDVLLLIFMNIKCQWDFAMEKPVVQQGRRWVMWCMQFIQQAVQIEDITHKTNK